jgi:putative ABC transport system substrate-binding protein
MKRREFIMLLGGAAATWPLAARAQQPAMPVVGFIVRGETQDSERVRAFRQSLADTGFVEGQNVRIEYRLAASRYEQLPALVADLIRQQVTVIVANFPAAVAAKAATTTIPIVFQVGVDPVQFGLVASLNRPAGNLTGVTSLNVEVAPKRLELLHELLPKEASFALLVNPANDNAEILSARLQAAARSLGLTLQVFEASTERELERVFAELRSGGLVIGGDPFFNSQSSRIAALGLRHAVPTVYQYRPFSSAGGLMSYGGNLAAPYRQIGNYVGRILKGEKPADLPVHQSTTVELIINLKTAKALGLNVPPTLLARADEVIE